MKTMMLGVAMFAAMATGCANGGESSPATDDVSVQTAFYGLTVMDCQQQATQCFKDNTGLRLFRKPVSCSVKLTSCLTKASAEVAGNVVHEVKDVTKCGTGGVSCFADARGLRNVLACENTVESCVLDTVNDLTGIPLPTSQQVAGAAIETAGQVVEVAVDATGQVIETAAEVTEHVVETAAGATREVVSTAVEVTTEVVETAANVSKEVVQTAAATGVKVVKNALQCGDESRQCIRTTRKLLSCQLAYTRCLATL